MAGCQMQDKPCADTERDYQWVLPRVRNWSAVGLRPYLTHRISRELASGRDLEAWVRFVFDLRIVIGPGPLSYLFTLRPQQRPSEIRQLLQLVHAERPRRVLEVGSAGGGTLFLWARVAAPDAFLVGMDLPRRNGRGLSGWRVALYEEAFPIPPQRIQIVRGDSHDDATASRVRQALGGEAVDFLFIDADHSYEGVRRDFDQYSPLVRPGGLIAFHDIVPDFSHRHGIRTRSDTGEVPRFWADLKQRYQGDREVLEIVEDPSQDGFGIGVVRA